MAGKMKKLPAILIVLSLCFGILTPGNADGFHDQLDRTGQSAAEQHYQSLPTRKMRASARIFNCC